MPRDELIVHVPELSYDGLAELLARSQASGYQFVRRLIDEWEHDINRFSRPGEALLGAIPLGGIVRFTHLPPDTPLGFQLFMASQCAICEHSIATH